MAHVGTQDVAVVDAGPKADGARSAGAKDRQVEEFYDLRPPSEVIVPECLPPGPAAARHVAA